MDCQLKPRATLELWIGAENAERACQRASMGHGE